jgi:hypothetical protein
MRRPHPSRFLLAPLAAAATLASCSDDPGEGTIILHLTDAPFPFEFVESTEVVIDSVAVKIGGLGGEDDGFLTIDRDQHVVDLLELQNGVTVPLSTAVVPAGTLTQARVYTGDATITLTDARTFPLSFPSGGSSGVKVFPHPAIEIPADETVEVLLDFDLSESFSAIPNAPTRVEDITSFQFHPVLRVTNLVDVGAVAGTVLDNLGTLLDTTDDVPLADATILVTQGLTEVASTSTDAAGEYAILGLLPGDYTVTASKGLAFSAESAPVTVTAAHETEGIDFVLDRIP